MRVVPIWWKPPIGWALTSSSLTQRLSGSLSQPAGSTDAKAEPPGFPVERGDQTDDAVDVDRRQPPVERDPRHADRVLLAIEHHPAVGVGRLLRPNDQRKVEPAEPLHQPGMERAGQPGVAPHQLLGRPSTANDPVRVGAVRCLTWR